MALEQLMDARICVQIRGARQSAGEHDQIEIPFQHRIQFYIRHQDRLPAAPHRPGLEPRGDHFDLSPAQQIDEGNGFEFFTTFCEGNEYGGHG